MAELDNDSYRTNKVLSLIFGDEADQQKGLLENIRIAVDAGLKDIAEMKVSNDKDPMHLLVAALSGLNKLANGLLASIKEAVQQLIQIVKGIEIPDNKLPPVSSDFKSKAAKNGQLQEEAIRLEQKINHNEPSSNLSAIKANNINQNKIVH